MKGNFSCVENNFKGSWKKVISTWAEMNSQYVSDLRDMPAWYVENANTALLSAASWACGHPSMCEPDVDKRKLTGRPGRPQEYVGRLDMEIFIDDNWMWLEAKKRHFQLTAEPKGAKGRSKRLLNLVEFARTEAEGSRKAAINAGWDVAPLAFFSASIAQDAAERSNDASERSGLGKEAACRKAIDEDLAAMLSELREYEASQNCDLEMAVFRNEKIRLQDWPDSDFPAAFGVVMIRL